MDIKDNLVKIAYNKFMKKKIICAIFSFAVIAIICIFTLFNFVYYPNAYGKFVEFYSEKYCVDKSLVYAVMKTESNFRFDAVSKSGAVGLMQIMPATAEWIASELNENYDLNNLFNPEINIRYGCFYIQYLLNKFRDKDIVICDYNAGEGIVSNWIIDGKLDKSKISYVETKNYLEKVNYYYEIYESKQK